MLVELLPRLPNVRLHFPLGNTDGPVFWFLTGSRCLARTGESPSNLAKPGALGLARARCRRVEDTLAEKSPWVGDRLVASYPPTTPARGSASSRSTAKPSGAVEGLPGLRPPSDGLTGPVAADRETFYSFTPASSTTPDRI
jgi:hypothetical protein